MHYSIFILWSRNLEHYKGNKEEVDSHCQDNGNDSDWSHQEFQTQTYARKQVAKIELRRQKPRNGRDI